MDIFNKEEIKELKDTIKNLREGIKKLREEESENELSGLKELRYCKICEELKTEGTYFKMSGGYGGGWYKTFVCKECAK